MAEEFDLRDMSGATLPLVQHLRYRVYIAEKGFALPGCDHDARRLHSEHDETGRTLVLFDGADLVASAQMHALGSRNPFSALDLAARLPASDAGAIIVSRLVSDPARRGAKTLGPVMRAILEHVRAENARYILLLAEQSMRGFYASMGFDPLGADIEVPPYGDIAPMAFDMRAAKHTSGQSLAGWMFKDIFSG